MQTGSTDYYVQLSSRTKGVFFDNNCGHFKIKLQTPLELSSGKWMAALTKIMYPHTWLNIKQENGKVYILHNDTTSKQPIIGKISTDADILISDVLNPLYNNADMSKLVLTRINLEPGYYADAGEIAANIVENFKSLRRGKDLERLAFNYLYESTSRTLQFFDATALIFENAEKFVNALGLKDSIPFNNDKFSGQVQVYGSTDRVTACGKSNIKKIDAIYAYSSIITFNLVGDSNVPLLTVIPVTGVHGQTVVYAPLKPEYKPVSQNYINDIEIELHKYNGDLIDFVDGEEVSITLHFKKSGVEL